MAEFGKVYRDEITGWEGKATGHQHLYGGLPKTLLERMDADGTISEVWFHDIRLVPPNESRSAAGFSSPREGGA